MTFLAPGFFFASLAVAAGVAALHFIVTRQPRAGILPTARFVPNLPATATAKHTRPSDLPLMLLRVLIVLAAGAGLARPIFKPSRQSEARVILADISRSTTNAAALRDSVRALYRKQDALIVFDSSARQQGGNAGDSIATLTASGRRGNLGAGLITAQRVASGLRDQADSLELVIVSSFGAEEFDAATDSIRRLWPGTARLVHVPAAVDSAAAGATIDVRSGASDPIQIAAGFARRIWGGNALIVRDGSETPPADARPVVYWPATTRPKGAVQAAPATVGGVTAQHALVVAAFDRRWTYPADSIRGGEVVARWIDGEPAAIEWRTGPGCIRSVAIPIISAGDLVLRDDFAQLVASLSADCVGKAASRAAAPQRIAALAGNGGLAPRDSFVPRDDVRSTIAPWLIALAIIAAITELIVRRQRIATAAGRASAQMDRAA